MIGQTGRRRRVLILADKEQVSLVGIEEKLEEAGFEPDVLDLWGCSNELVYSVLSETHYDVLLPTNWFLSPSYMPELVTETRKKFPAIKIVVMSGYSPLAFVNDLARRGIDDFFPVMFDVDEFVSRIRELTGNVGPYRTASPRRISLLLSNSFDRSFSTLFESYGFKVLWSETFSDLEAMILSSHVDIAIEMGIGGPEFPVRDLFRRYARDTSVLLALADKKEVRADLQGSGFAGSLALPLDPTEIREKFLEALPATRHALLSQTALWKGGETARG